MKTNFKAGDRVWSNKYNDVFILSDKASELKGYLVAQTIDGNYLYLREDDITDSRNRFAKNERVIDKTDGSFVYFKEYNPDGSVIIIKNKKPVVYPFFDIQSTSIIYDSEKYFKFEFGDLVWNKIKMQIEVFEKFRENMNDVVVVRLGYTRNYEYIWNLEPYCGQTKKAPYEETISVNDLVIINPYKAFFYAKIQSINGIHDKFEIPDIIFGVVILKTTNNVIVSVSENHIVHFYFKETIGDLTHMGIERIGEL